MDRPPASFPTPVQPDTRLVYVADPMCSWCWGFEPELRRLRERFGAGCLELRVGGLRTGPDLPPWSELQEFLRATWRRIANLTGQSFDESFLERPSFRYDTEPACRALVCARRLCERHPTRVFDYFTAIQSAFYGSGQDVTSAAVLGALAVEQGFDGAHFEELFEDPASAVATRDEFAAMRGLGIVGFPTLVALVPDAAGTPRAEIVIRGFATSAELEPRLEPLF